MAQIDVEVEKVIIESFTGPTFKAVDASFAYRTLHFTAAVFFLAAFADFLIL